MRLECDDTAVGNSVDGITKRNSSFELRAVPLIKVLTNQKLNALVTASHDNVFVAKPN